MNILEQKFSSGNNTQVDRITLTREEYEELLETHTIVPNEPELKKLCMVEHGINLQLEGGAIQFFASTFVDQFKGAGAKNYLEMSFTHDEFGEFVLPLADFSYFSPQLEIRLRV